MCGGVWPLLLPWKPKEALEPLPGLCSREFSASRRVLGMREETRGQLSALRPLASQPGRIQLSRCLGPAGFLFISTAAHKP